jgi:hypothetical protein
MSHEHTYGPVDLLQPYPVKLTSSVPDHTISIGDLVAELSGAAVRADQFTWTTDLATTQAAFALALLGISADRSLEDDTSELALNIAIHMDGDFYVDMAAAGTFDVGDYLGPAKHASNNTLINELAPVANKSLATHVVVKKETASTTRVLARLINTPVKR